MSTVPTLERQKVEDPWSALVSLKDLCQRRGKLKQTFDMELCPPHVCTHMNSYLNAHKDTPISTYTYIPSTHPYTRNNMYTYAENKIWALLNKHQNILQSHLKEMDAILSLDRKSLFPMALKSIPNVSYPYLCPLCPTFAFF